jgi:quercetin dioxygenase-like cupin family protein
MSSANLIPLANLGSIGGAMYDFDLAGDILPKHTHDETTVHITIVARGKVRAYSHDWSIEAVAGQILDFQPHQPHEIMALENNTRIFNILKTRDDISDGYTPPPQA